MGFLGKSIRLARLFRDDGRAVLITFDHAIAHGVLEGLEDPGRKLRAILDGVPDGVTVQKGIASRHWPADASTRTGLVVKATSYAPYHKTYDSPTATVEEAIRLGADAISVGVIVGGARQSDQTRFLADVVREAEGVGLPVGAHIYPRGEAIEAPGAPDFAYAVRVGAEIGIDFVKTNWFGDAEGFGRIVEAAGIPVLVAGGAPADAGFEGLLATTRDAIATGAAGVAYGRAVWSDPDPAARIRELHAVVHGEGGAR